MSKRQKAILVVVLLLVLALAIVLRIKKVNHRNQVANQTDQFVQQLYKTNPIEAQCLQKYYQQYPEARPENRKQGTGFIAPPCPDFPQ